jgi:hypothetical protein
MNAKKYIARVKRCIPVDRAATKVWNTVLVRELEKGRSAGQALRAANSARRKRLGACATLRW